MHEMGGSSCVQAHIGQALMQLAKPRGPLIPPMQLLLGLKAHTLFGSREIVDVLHSAGFAVSYDEIGKFLRCAAVSPEEMDEADNFYMQVDTYHTIFYKYYVYLLYTMFVPKY